MIKMPYEKETDLDIVMRYNTLHFTLQNLHWFCAWIIGSCSRFVSYFSVVYLHI